MEIRSEKWLTALPHAQCLSREHGVACSQQAEEAAGPGLLRAGDQERFLGHF